MWFLAPYQSGSAIGESEKVAGAWGTGLVQAGAAFQTTCLTALCAYFAWEERAEVKWAPLEDTCVQTRVCLRVCVYTHMNMFVGVHEMCGVCLQAIVYVYIKYVLI